MSAARLLRWGIAAGLTCLSACGKASPDTAPGAIVTADTALVAAIADLHVLDARRALVADATADGDSLRRAVLALHGFDEATYARALEDVAQNPDLTSVTWMSAQDRIDALLRPSPDTAAAPVDSVR